MEAAVELLSKFEGWRVQHPRGNAPTTEEEMAKYMEDIEQVGRIGAEIFGAAVWIRMIRTRPPHVWDMPDWDFVDYAIDLTRWLLAAIETPGSGAAGPA